MSVKKNFHLLAALFASTWSPFAAVHAAEITKTPNEEMHCYLSVQGPIEMGDADRIRHAMADFSTDHPEDAKLFYPNSMNSWRKVCFDSIGGSFTEGVKIAQYLLRENIGSAVPRDAECLSACAVAFMGGTNDTKQDMGAIPFRQLHPLGSLGFHVPFIEVPDREYSGQIVQQAFEGALSNIGFLLEQGDKMRIKRSLVLRMLKTPSKDMHLVETVGEASRWGIAIAPVAFHNKLEPASVVNACYNHEYYLQDKLMPIFARSKDVAMAMAGSTEIGTLPFGFRSERASHCEVRQPPVSEFDLYGPLTHRGIHTITEHEGIYPYQMYDPQTPITALFTPDGSPPARVPKFENRTYADAVCLIISDGELHEKEPCRWEIVKTRHADLAVEEAWYFHWPSGSQTIIAKGNTEEQQADTLNGSPAQSFESWELPQGIRTAINDAAQILTVPNDGWLNESCWRSSATGRVFCVGSFGGVETMGTQGYAE